MPRDQQIPEEHEKRRTKGIGRASRDKLTHEMFLKTYLESTGPTCISEKRFNSKLHTIYTVELDKRGLCPFDDKRYLLQDIMDEEIGSDGSKPGDLGIWSWIYCGSASG